MLEEKRRPRAMPSDPSPSEIPPHEGESTERPADRRSLSETILDMTANSGADNPDLAEAALQLGVQGLVKAGSALTRAVTGTANALADAGAGAAGLAADAIRAAAEAAPPALEAAGSGGGSVVSGAATAAQLASSAVSAAADLASAVDAAEIASAALEVAGA